MEPLQLVRRVLEEVKDELRAKEFDIVDVDAKGFNDCQRLANKFFGVEGGNHMLIIVESRGASHPMAGVTNEAKNASERG